MEITYYEVAGKKFMQDSTGNLILEENIRQASKKISLAKDLIPFLSQERKAEQEQVIVFTLDGNNQMIQKHVVCKGIVNSCQIHPREIFRAAIENNAVSIIVVHNHPSGNKQPSDSDYAATKKLAEAGNIIGIPLLDHMIITSTDFTSIREYNPRLF